MLKWPDFRERVIQAGEDSSGYDDAPDELESAAADELATEPKPGTVVYDGAEVDFYQPEIKQMTISRAGANRSQLESFLTLGFGGSGADLEANWKVSLLGPDNVDGVPVVELDLVPVQQKVLDMFTHVTIWVDPTRGISYKQVLYQPSGDKRTATYKNIRYNQPIADTIFHIETAPGTTKIVR